MHLVTGQMGVWGGEGSAAKDADELGEVSGSSKVNCDQNAIRFQTPLDLPKAFD
jgi:hypothetical protein